MEEVEVKTNEHLGFYGCNMLVRYARIAESRDQKLVINMEQTTELTETGCAILMRAANNNPHIEFDNVSPEIRKLMDQVGQIIKEATPDGPE